MVRALSIAVLAGMVAATPAVAAPGLQFVGTFDDPVYLTGAPGDYERIYVVEQGGRIRVVDREGLRAAPFVDLSAVVKSPADGGGVEQGLLSVAFAPDFPTSRLLYVFFTGAQDELRVERLRAPRADRADRASRRRILTVPHHEERNHNGGQLAFGPDGFLYAATGDGGSFYDAPRRDARDPRRLLGKILRVDRHAGASAPGNPFGNQVWAYGLRNPYRFSFDRLAGDLLIGDVGEDEIEEVNWAPAASGGGRGAFFGWDDCEGTFAAEPKPTNLAVPCPLTNDQLPVIQRTHDPEHWCSVIGGFVVRDPSLPTLEGRYLYGDYCAGSLRSARLEFPFVTDDLDTGLRVTHLSGFGEDTAGCVYATSVDGPVYRVVDRETELPCRRRPRVPGPQPGDSKPPRMRAHAPSPQRLRRRAPIVQARCSEHCTVDVRGFVRADGRRFRLRPVSGKTGTRHAVALHPRITVRAARRARVAFRLGRPVVIEISVRARDAVQNAARPAHLAIRLSP